MGTAERRFLRLRDCLPKDVWRVSLFRVLGYTGFFRKCGEKSETSEHNPVFANKIAGRGSHNLGCLATIAIIHFKYVEHRHQLGRLYAESLYRFFSHAPKI